MKKIKFTVLHPAGTNVDLIKDEGQIPFFLKKIDNNIEPTLVACNIDYKNINTENINGVRIEHFPKILNYPLTGVVYLILNSKKIDWLNIYFAGRQAYIWMKLYKYLNKNGHIYLKLDMDFKSCDLYDSNRIERKIFTKNTKLADIVSVESIAVKDRIQKYSARKILLIEDGVSQSVSKPVTNQKRDNVFITVARLGTYQKATEILLEAFEKSSKEHNWNLKLIGSIEEDFKKYIDKYFNKYPEMKERVCFCGVIKNRDSLYSEYRKAKVFVLPSRWESFGISAAEALCNGCYLILSDSIPPANEMTRNGKYGEIVKTGDVESLCEALRRASKLEYTKSEIDELINYANMQFSWDRICRKLLNEMYNVTGEIDDK